MKKLETVVIVIIAIISIALAAFMANKLLDTTGKVNQGNFRITDVIVESSAKVVDVQSKDVTIEKLTDMTFEVSQTNKISILIESNVDATEIYLDNINISSPELVGQMKIYQDNRYKTNLEDQLSMMPINIEKDDSNYIINLYIDNEKILTNAKVSEGVDTIKYDAAIFEILDIEISKLQFNVNFDLVISDKTGKKVRTSMSFVMPSEDTLTQGMSVLRQDVSKYLFTIEK